MKRNDEFADSASYGKYHFDSDEPGEMGSSIIARSTNKDGVPGKRVGRLSWYPGKPTYESGNINGGVIASVYVSSQFRRKGIASAMLDYARAVHPDRDVRHSNALTNDGEAWAKATPTPRNLPNNEK